MVSNPETNTTFIILVSCIATIGGFLFGFDSGVINGTVDGLKNAFDSDSVGTGFNVASMLLGCAMGAFFAGRLADIYGRKTMLIVAAVLFVVSSFGSGMADSSAAFIVYRILGGLAVGAASVMAPAYISEVTPAEFRGRMTTVQQIAIICGLFVSFLSNYFLANIAGASTQVLWLGFEAWRWMFWMELLPAVVFFVALFFIPESPRYLALCGKRDKAKAVLAKLYGASVADSTFSQISSSIASSSRPKFSDVLDGNGKVRKVIWVGLGLASFQQLVGINVIFYYGAVLWQAVGFTEADALLINILSGAISIGAVLLALTLIDRFGRKPLLIAGSIGMSVTLLFATYAFSSVVSSGDGIELSENMGLLALISANAYVFFFNFSWGPVMWVMLGEMFPNQLRGSGLALSGLLQWLTNFAITMTFPILLTGVGLAGAYSVYAAFALLSVIFVAKCITETKGRTLEEMPGV